MNRFWSAASSRKLVLLFLSALTVRLVFFLVAYANNGPRFGVDQAPDALAYHQLAVNLLEGHGFSSSHQFLDNGGMPSLEGGAPFLVETFRTPGYPAFLVVVYWIFGKLPQLALVLQAAIGAFTCVLATTLETRIFGDQSAGISGWILAFYPLSIIYDNSLLTESVFTCLLTLSFLFLTRFLEGWHRKHACLSGFFLGLATLCRPISTYLPVLLILWIGAARLMKMSRIPWKDVLLSSALFYASFFAVVYPWILRNQMVSGKSQISLLSSSDAWMRPLAYMRSLRSGEKADFELQRIWEEYDSINESSTAREYVFSALGEIVDGPPYYWLLWVWGLVVALYSPQTAYTGALLLGTGFSTPVDVLSSFARRDVVDFVSHFMTKKSLLELAYIALMVVYSSLLYGMGIYCLVRRHHSMAVVAAALVIAYLVCVPGAFSDGRYRVPAMPLVVILFSWGIFQILPGRAGLCKYMH